jgi:site-specific DNA-cytosine methylase
MFSIGSDGGRGADAMDEVLRAIKQRLDEVGLGLAEAAAQIGVTVASLERHLGGAYVRSDSLAKYRAWLAGRRSSTHRRQGQFPGFAGPTDATEDRQAGQPEIRFSCPPFGRDRPFNVVDLFSGCGGMSLGFDLLGAEDGGDESGVPSRRLGESVVFQTILALDIDAKAVGLQNRNHPVHGSLQGGPARRVDVADFIGPAEVLAFYLDHLAARSGEIDLRQALDQLHPLGLADFTGAIHRIDSRFLGALAEIRSGASFRRAYGEIDSSVFGQTSVQGFQEALGLPETSTGRPLLGPLVWADRPGGAAREAEPPIPPDVRPEAVAWLDRQWDGEVAKLEARTAGKGAGQLASSAGRIRRFLDFLKTEPMGQVKEAWLCWKGARDALRRFAFGNQEVEERLRALSAGHRRVDVLLGGPPCQGFSRIGRGKIRSLREHRVHVETSPEAGDVRNLLLLKYVEFVSALAPRVFLFENVRHFQASVRTPEGTFQATEALNEAIQELSERRLSYRVRDRIVDCTRHLIPQTRERFVMVGVRSDVEPPGVEPDLLPTWCLALAVFDPVPLRVAFGGLPPPLLARGQRAERAGGVTLAVEQGPSLKPGSASLYLNWVRQGAPPERGAANARVDAHYIREPRPDDRAFFELLGPGRRWMDYRCDSSRTLEDLRRLLEQVRDAAPSGIDPGAVDDLLSRLDGSLSLRLLLERIEPREGELHHHLLAPGYLAKREGNNGDWVARLHPDRPCKTIVSHMAKDTYAYVHPSEPRTLSVREAARVQTFPDWFRFGSLGLVDAFRAVGNAVPPLLSYQFARKLALLLWADEAGRGARASTNESAPPLHEAS